MGRWGHDSEDKKYPRSLFKNVAYLVAYYLPSASSPKHTRNVTNKEKEESSLAYFKVVPFPLPLMEARGDFSQITTVIICE